MEDLKELLIAAIQAGIVLSVGLLVCIAVLTAGLKLLDFIFGAT